MREYVKDFQKLGLGLFVHFGIYSVIGRGEWAKEIHKISDAEYDEYAKKFNPKKNWAKELVRTAKKAGCKYITLTTRHHDGFSLFDTKGLSTYDSMHYCNRDLIREFVEACNQGGIIPFFYHTLLDWREPTYKTDFPKYIDYLIASVETLCTNYGKIGGFWFDGMWDKRGENWQEDRLYGTIRKHQPTAMIINNTGLSEQGKVGHVEIDSVTFERGKPKFVDNSDRIRAGEMCQVLNDHWGYASGDCNYKSVKELLFNLIDCRKYGCNFLINTGLMGNGSVNSMDASLLGAIGKWIKANKKFIYNVISSDVYSDGADLLKNGDTYYVAIKNVGMSADPNVALNECIKTITLDKRIKSAVWLDNGKNVEFNGNQIKTQPFSYGESLGVRVAKVKFYNS